MSQAAYQDFNREQMRPALESDGRDLRESRLQGLGSVRLEDPRLLRIADSSAKLPDRLAALRDLASAPYDEAMAAEIASYLISPMPPGAGAVERERAVRNDLLNHARNMAAGAERALVGVLADQSASPEQDMGLRDYALQHLAAWVPSLPEAERVIAIASLRQALTYREGTLAGTALLGLDGLLASGDAAVRAADIKDTAVVIVLDDGFSVESRMTALLVCTERGVQHDRLRRLSESWIEQPNLPAGARLVARNYLNSHS